MKRMPSSKSPAPVAWAKAKPTANSSVSGANESSQQSPKDLLMTDTANLIEVPPGVCPACLKPIARKEFRIARKFRCLRCGKYLQAPRLLRIFMHSLCIGVPLLLACWWGKGLVRGIILYIFLSFIFSMLFSAIATAKHLPKLELAHEKEEIQSLNLSN